MMPSEANGRLLIGALALPVLLAAGISAAQDRSPSAIASESVRWASPPDLPGVQAAWFVGGPEVPGAYLFRVKLAAGAR